MALLAAIRAPELPGALIACGANTTPAGLKWPVRLGMALRYLVCREPRTKMMLCQPQISPAMLGRIQVPTLVLCGAHDMIRPADSRAIAAAIPGARLQNCPMRATVLILSTVLNWPTWCWHFCDPCEVPPACDGNG